MVFNGSVDVVFAFKKDLKASIEALAAIALTEEHQR